MSEVEQHGFAVIDVEKMRVIATAERFDTATKLAKVGIEDSKEVLIFKLVARMNNKNRGE